MVRSFYYMPDILHAEEEVYVDIYRAEEYIHRNMETPPSSISDILIYNN